MKFVSRTKPMAVPHQIHTYTELRQQVHNDLRIQHPEWIEPNGESPMCDSYDARLMDLLDTLTRRGIQRVYRCSSSRTFRPQEGKEGQSMTAIVVPFPDECVKLDDVEERRVLTTLEVIYEGGSLHGKTADFPTRDLERVVLASTGVIGISLKPMSARSASIFAAGERSFAAPASLLNPTTAVGGRGCSRSFASAN